MVFGGHCFRCTVGCGHRHLDGISRAIGIGLSYNGLLQADDIRQAKPFSPELFSSFYQYGIYKILLRLTGGVV